MPDIKDSLRENAEGPKSVRSDAATVEQHDLKDQIAAAKYLEGEEQVAGARRGLRISRLVPPGTT